MHHEHEAIALYAALDEDSRAFWMAIGRGMLPNPTAKHPVLKLLSFGGNPGKKLGGESVIGSPGATVTTITGEPVRS